MKKLLAIYQLDFETLEEVIDGQERADEAGLTPEYSEFELKTRIGISEEGYYLEVEIYGEE